MMDPDELQQNLNGYGDRDYDQIGIRNQYKVASDYNSFNGLDDDSNDQDYSYREDL